MGFWGKGECKLTSSELEQLMKRDKMLLKNVYSL